MHLYFFEYYWFWPISFFYYIVLRSIMEFDFTLPGLGRPESSRPKRVAEAISNELSILLLQKVRDNRLRNVTILSVKMSPDLRLATIFYSVDPDSDIKQVSKGFERAKGFFRSQIARRLNLRYTPELVFRYDNKYKSNERLEELFQEIAEEKKANDKST